MKKGLTIVSLFHGPGGSQFALEELGVKINKLYASEVDKFAIEAASIIYPETIHLGDVAKWREWGIDWKSVDALTGGFSCQSFSLAGLRKGFDDPRGQHALITAEILAYAKTQNPNIKFMLENVKMDKKSMIELSGMFDCEPVLINAERVLPQNRERYFWSNCELKQPERADIVLRDIEETGFPHKYGLCTMRRAKKDAVCQHVANADDIKGSESIKRVYSMNSKGPTLTTMGGGHREPKFLASFGVYRKASLREMMRMQGWPERVQNIMLDKFSAAQIKKMVGNGWPNDVIKSNFVCMGLAKSS